MDKPPLLKNHKLENATIKWLDSGLPFCRRFNDVYHSQYDNRDHSSKPEDSNNDTESGNNNTASGNDTHLLITHRQPDEGGALAGSNSVVSNFSAQDEAQHVFLQANQLRQRWQDLAKLSPGNEFSLAELGFGSGLNFLLCWRLWRETAPPHCFLHYTAVEKFPLNLRDIRRIHQLWPELKELSEQFLQCYQDHSKGIHRLHFDEDRITLDLCFEDARTVLEQRESHNSQLVDCWFLDGFSPSCNPSMWSPDLVSLIADNSQNNSTLSTYSVSSSIRKPLLEHGFEVSKLPGYGRKRHMLAASFKPESPRPTKALRASWFIPANSASKVKRTTPLHVAIIGGGIAGCSTAYSLAQKGCRVSIFEQTQNICQGASGNLQAALQLQLSQSFTAESSLKLSSYLYAVNQYQAFARSNKLNWQQCGLVQTSNAFNRKASARIEDLKALYDHRVLSDHIAQAEMIKDPICCFPLSGWLNIEQLCQAYISHPNIDLQCASQVTDIKADAALWSIYTSNGGELSADRVVIANSFAYNDLANTSDMAFEALPLQTSEGQVSHIPSLDHKGFQPGSLPVVCGEKTLFPPTQGLQSIAASYQTHQHKAGGKQPDINQLDQENIKAAANLFNNTEICEAVLRSQVCSNRKSTRCNSRDFMPVVGQAFDNTATSQIYADLKKSGKGSRHIKSLRAQHIPGLYINIAHGSHGLSSCPLMGEFLASVICEHASPLTMAQSDCINPIRFLMRELAKA